MTKKLPLLGHRTTNEFLRDYWHKQPLLVRGARPPDEPLISRDALFDLAQANNTDHVEARLVTYFKKRWKVHHLHQSHTTLPSLQQKNWTLLVQGVNLYNDAVDALLRQFRFIPDARLDDVMISVATDGGGVGPHVDSYDVFLLQVQGKRRWDIGPVDNTKDMSWVKNCPLNILEHFEPSETFVLEPGDMLYLPPNIIHHGVAIGECMTASIGFRAPDFQALGEAFLQFMTDSIDLPGRYADPDLKAVTSPAEISAQMLSRISRELGNIRFTREDITLFLGEYFSEPKMNIVFDPPKRPLTWECFQASAARRGVRLSKKTQMLYRDAHVFINGEAFCAQANDLPSVTLLANARQLTGEVVSTASKDVMEALYTWYLDGWVDLGP